MSSIYSWNVPVTVPPVHDTTPCMDYMLAYEECLVDAVPRHTEVFHPNWPTIWPRLLTDGKLRPDLIENQELEQGPKQAKAFSWNRPIPPSIREKLWECEEERFTYKACLRKLIGLKNDPRSRLPVWQPEENQPRSLGKRQEILPDNRYPFDMYHNQRISEAQYFRKLWEEFVEEGGDV